MTNPIGEFSDARLIEELERFCPKTAKEIEQNYFLRSINRYRRLFLALPHGGGEKSLLDIGARLYTAFIYANYLDYARVAVATKWETPYTEASLLARIPRHERISVQHFDAENTVFPYRDGEFDVVVCSELLEHLAIDPMFMLAEINRVTRPDGLLVLTTPNAASWASLRKVLEGKHPYTWSMYNGSSTDRHNREYTIDELDRLIANCGYQLVKSETFSASGQGFSLKEKVLSAWFSLPDTLRGKPGLNPSRRGETSLVVGRKVSAIQDRYPSWLYFDPRPTARPSLES
ncbi:class I SAM-dependent methyltransferase [Candidatus Methylocalor cossyra]|uniref:Methyltransferase type 11 domain-containing protein n=1 Tax=Candidatus Methylocalor cossyra TaxID=3108543 RepID=A0ABP1C847_9GAMM